MRPWERVGGSEEDAINAAKRVSLSVSAYEVSDSLKGKGKVRVLCAGPAGYQSTRPLRRACRSAMARQDRGPGEASQGRRSTCDHGKSLVGGFRLQDSGRLAALPGWRYVIGGTQTPQRRRSVSFRAPSHRCIVACQRSRIHLLTMAGDDDLRAAAQSTAVDYYELLGITFESSETNLKKAYRQAALKYHPDKNPDKPDIVQKFHLLQVAYDVLSQPEYKAIYDNTRRAKKEKEERHQAFEGRRRQMKEDLENREAASLKRKHYEEEEGDKLQREIQRLAADGKRRRLERQDQLNREKLEQEERLDRERDGYIVPQSSASVPQGGARVPDLDRSIKVIWPKEGRGEAIDRDRLEAMFAAFGKVQSAVLLKEKKKRLGSSKTKSMVATGLVVYESVVGAHAAVEDYKKQSDSDFKVIDSVFWASGKEPEFLRSSTPRPTTPVSETKPQRPLRDIPGMDSPVTPLKQSDGGLRKVPSFASFSSAKNSPVATFSAAAAQSPSLEELTMIRLKNAEKRRLEEQIRKQDAEAEAANKP